MNISKKAAQELLSQNFYNQALCLTILSTHGIVLAQRSNSTKNKIEATHIASLIQQVQNNPAVFYENQTDLDECVSISILYKDTQIIGYLLIQGPEEQVQLNGKLILTIVTMYLNSNFRFTSTCPITDRQRSDVFLRELVTAAGQLNPFLINEARHFKLNINHTLYVAIIYSTSGFADDDPLYNLRNRINGRTTLLTAKILMIVFESRTALEYLQQWCQPNSKISVSTKSKNLLNAYHEAVTTAMLTEWLKSEKDVNQVIVQFHELQSFIPIVHAKIDVRSLVDIIICFDSSIENHELLETFWTFFQNNGRIKITAEKLHIHRNTLTFRLDTLGELFKLDLNSFDQRTLLYIAMVKYKTYALDASLRIADELLEYDLD
ncbi:MAG: helix-turn-helix domain-containing protein [Lactobacillaceae bacterium]|nr:helix-turn-helix domain-containing protein [Lactobacillaceae bacterium]